MPGNVPGSHLPQPTPNNNVQKKFVGRQQLIERFQAMLAGEHPARIMSVVAPPGCGKSWLLLCLKSEAVKEQVPTSLIDYSFGQVHDDIWMAHHLANELGAEAFVKLNQELQEASRLEVVVKIETPAVTSHIEIQGDVHVQGELNIVGGNIIQGNTFNFNVSDTGLRQIWASRITHAFCADLAALGESRRAVLIFDAYHIATKEARTWFTDTLLTSVASGEMPGVFLLLASDEVFPFRPEWESLIAREELATLELEDVRAYFQEKTSREVNPSTLEKIFRVTGGRVDQIDLIAEYPPEQPLDLETEQLYQVLVQGILRSHPKGDAVTELLAAAALTDWFDAPLMADLLQDNQGIDERLNDIQQFSFVSRDASGAWRISGQAVRSELIKTWEDKQQQYLVLQRRAADHFRQRVAITVDQSLRENLEIQAAGHLLEVDEVGGMQALKELFQKAVDFYRLSTCELLLQRAAKVAKLSGSSRLWLQYYSARLAFERNDFDSSERQLKSLISKVEEGCELYALVMEGLGAVKGKLSSWAEAIQFYDLGLKIFTAHQDTVKAGQMKLALCDIYIDQARAIGDPIQPKIVRGRGWKDILKAIPSILVAFSYVIYDRLFQHWGLPPLHQGMNYRNWSLVNLLLTAARWCKEAEVDLRTTNREDLAINAKWKLAEIYYRLGWQQKASQLFQDVLDSGPVVNNPYLAAQVSLGYAEVTLSLGQYEAAIPVLKKALKRFLQLKDQHAQAEACVLLGKAWMQAGKIGSGLAFYRYSLRLYQALDNYAAAGLAIQALHEWQRHPDLRPGEREAIENLIRETPDKIYPLRVPDKLAALLEAWVAALLIFLAVGAVFVFSLAFNANLTDPGRYLAQVFSLRSILYIIGGALLVFGLVVAVTSGLGLILILISIRQKPKPELLGQIETRAPEVSRRNYLGQVQRIPWGEIQAVVSQERVLWRAPLALLSEYRLIGTSREHPLAAPATLAWYEDFKSDIQAHIEQNHLQPQWHKLDLRILGSWQGILLLLAPLLGCLGSVFVYNWVDLPLSVEAAAQLGTWLIVLCVVGLVAGPYWWMVLYPLWVHYRHQPRSPLLWAAIGLGLALVGCAFYLSYFDPFFPVRQALERVIFPLGFVLLLVVPAWMIGARQPGLAAGAYAYPSRVRLLAGLLLVLALLATGFYAYRVWRIHLFYNFQPIAHFYHGDYAGAIERFDRALEQNPDLVNAYYYQGRAYLEMQQYSLAEEKFDHVVASGHAIAADYVFRAQALHGAGKDALACQDLKFAIEDRGWLQFASKEEQDRMMQDFWEPWGCTNYP